MSDIAMVRVYKAEAGRQVEMEATNVDTGKTERNCPHCFESQQTLKDTIAENEKLIGQLKGHQVDVAFYYRRCGELKKRSDAITSSMANVMEEKSDLENINDENSNSKLGKRFDCLYDKEWADLCDWLSDNVTMDELDRIKTLSDLLQRAYTECCKLADEQIRQFLFLDSEDELPDDKKEPTLYKERRQQGQGEKIREQIQKRIVNTVVTEESMHNFCPNQEDEKLNDIKTRIKNFLCEYINLCWLFTISHPRPHLEFDVVDKPYTKVKERFRDFSCQETVSDNTKVKDSVYCVVWPCVILEDASGIIAKGDVITVDVGKEQ